MARGLYKVELQARFKGLSGLQNVRLNVIARGGQEAVNKANKMITSKKLYGEYPSTFCQWYSCEFIDEEDTSVNI